MGLCDRFRTGDPVACRRRVRADRATRERLAVLLPLIGTLVLSLGVPLGAAAQDEDSEPAEWAIRAPLSPRSLLLDVALAGDRLVAVGERGHILLSDDSGVSWRQVSVPTRAMLTGVFFLDDRLGWAVGHDAVILRTTDGGESWEMVYSAPEDETPFLDVYFRDAERGYAMGAYGYFYVTEDGGDSWEWRAISDDDSHLNQICASPGGVLYLAAERGMLYRSDDGGDTWLELASPYDGSFFGSLAVTDDEVLVFGLRGHLFRSDDGGDSWQQLETDTVAMLTDGVALEDGPIVVVGLGGAVLVSDDGGHSFALHAQLNRLGTAAAIEAPDGTLVLVGEGGARRLEAEELAAAAKGQGGGEAP